MKKIKRALAAFLSAAMLCGALAVPAMPASAADSIESNYTWGAMKIGGGGFVSGIVTGKDTMYARTDVGGAYRYNYDTDSWEQLFSFINETDKGMLSVDAMAIDPTDDNTVYFLCGCAYFSDARTAIYKTTDGGKTFTIVDVTDLIQVHGNGNGRHTGESIAIDPDNPNVLYCGGDVTAGESCLIKSTDGGETWKPVKSYDDLGLYKETIKWPFWTEHETRALINDEYRFQNGVASIKIYGGKVYVATSTTGKNSLVCADVKTDEFTDLSAIDTEHYPARITSNGKGLLYITYQSSLSNSDAGMSGAIYKYDTATGEAVNIAPTANGFSEVHVDPKNPDRLITSTSGLWYSQMWQAWSDEHSPAWGDRFFRSEDGGETWREITPGNELSWGGPLAAHYLEDNGYAWIRDKAIHWVGSLVIDPRNSDRIHITSGNGVFCCDDTWAETPTLYFHPDGIEEVVSLDFCSTADGYDVSAIGDYDGFVHESPDVIGIQHKPNMGSTSSIAICPQDTNIWFRLAEGDNDVASAFYSKDAGKTWIKTTGPKGGKAAIAKIGDTYRIFASAKGGGQYSDDFGETWESISLTGLYYDMRPGFLPDPENPEIVWAYGYSKAANQYDTTPTEYKLYKSTDGGKTFSAPTSVCPYDSCDAATRIAYLGGGDIVLGGGWNGAYKVNGKTDEIEKLPVFYCKTIGYGCGEKAGDPNALYMYGRPTEADIEGLYRSTDSGQTWLLINTENLYGGTGNGNYIVGDMDEFGKMYMSTVGCGIIYGEVTGSEKPKPVTPSESGDKETDPKDTDPKDTDSKETDPKDTDSKDTDPKDDKPADGEPFYGDVNCDGEVDIMDVIKLNKYLLGSGELDAQGKLNANVDANKSIDTTDSLNILKCVVALVKQTDFPIK